MILKAKFTLVKAVSKVFSNIAYGFAWLACLGHTPEIEMILFGVFATKLYQSIRALKIPTTIKAPLVNENHVTDF